MLRILGLAAFILISNCGLFQGDSTSLYLRYHVFSKNEYKIGSKSVDKKEFKQTLYQSDEARQKYISGKTKVILGDVIAVPSILVLVVTLDQDTKPFAWQWAVGGMGTVGGLLLSHLGRKQTLKSVEIYNSDRLGRVELNISTQMALTLKLK